MVHLPLAEMNMCVRPFRWRYYARTIPITDPDVLCQTEARWPGFGAPVQLKLPTQKRWCGGRRG